jgi:hypothetical protein
MADWTRLDPDHARLCGAVLALGKAAAARLTCRDGEEGFTAVADTDQIPLAQLGEVFGARIEGFGRALEAAELADLDRPIARLVGLLGNPQESVLLALAAGPSLDRALDRVHRNLGRGEAMTAGFLLDLAAPGEETRLVLAGALHPMAPLRRYALLVSPWPEAAISTTPLAVAPSVVAALRGEEIAPPAEVEAERLAVDSALGSALATTLGLPPLRPGEMVVLEGPPPVARLLARILALGWGRAAWLGAVPADRLVDALRDATLANALLAIDLDAAGPRIGPALRRCRQAVVRTDLPLVGWSAQPIGSLPGDLADRVTSFDCRAALARPRLVAATERLETAPSAVAPLPSWIGELAGYGG